MSSKSSSRDKERASKEAADKAAAKAALEKYKKRADPATVEELLGTKELNDEYLGGDVGKWKAAWAIVEFDDDACLKNVTKAGKAKDGYFAPAGSILPLGASFPDMTVLKYGGYFPAGTAFPGGVLIPLHARMVNLLPQQTTVPSSVPTESLCVVQ